MQPGFQFEEEALRAQGGPGTLLRSGFQFESLGTSWSNLVLSPSNWLRRALLKDIFLPYFLQYFSVVLVVHKVFFLNCFPFLLKGLKQPLKNFKSAYKGILKAFKTPLKHL